MHFQKKYFKISFQTVFLFAAIWLMVGFSTGTATLIGPVRWITTEMRDLHVNQNNEDLVVKTIIGVLILVSALISLWLTRFIVNRSQITSTFIVLSACATAAILSLWLWLHPQYASQGIETSIMMENKSFTFGQYPTEERMIQLKEEGYTDVISLLNSTVVPFEGKLFDDVKNIAENVGLRIIHIPMVPWVSENEDAIIKMKEIAKHGRGKYYIHCYLGKDRINVVKRVLEQYNAVVSSIDVQASRTLNGKESFERGAITKLDTAVYLIPYPTDEEYLGFILSGSIKYVVSIMDTSIVENGEWIAKEKKITNVYQMPFEILSMRADTIDTLKMLDVVGYVKKLPKPVVVHDFRSDSPASKEFIRLYSLGIDKVWK